MPTARRRLTRAIGGATDPGAWRVRVAADETRVLGWALEGGYADAFVAMRASWIESEAGVVLFVVVLRRLAGMVGIVACPPPPGTPPAIRCSWSLARNCLSCAAASFKKPLKFNVTQQPGIWMGPRVHPWVSDGDNHHSPRNSSSAPIYHTLCTYSEVHRSSALGANR